MASASAERCKAQQTGERTGSRPSAAAGGGALAPALRPADHRSTSTQLLPGGASLLSPSPLRSVSFSRTFRQHTRRQDHTT